MGSRDAGEDNGSVENERVQWLEHRPKIKLLDGFGPRSEDRPWRLRVPQRRRWWAAVAESISKIDAQQA